MSFGGFLPRLAKVDVGCGDLQGQIWAETGQNLLGHLNRVELAKECLLHFMRRYSARRVARQDICCGDQRSGNQANGATALIARISSASASSVFPRNLARTDEPRHALNLCS